MDDQSMFNYCTRCGNELDEREANAVVDESDAPPLCRVCFVELSQGVFRGVAKFSVAVENAFFEAFRPLAEAAASTQATPAGDSDE